MSVNMFWVLLLLVVIPTQQEAVDPYRTAFHFQPKRNFMNDPNGPMIYNRLYHMFYQYNPNGATVGEPVWGHSTSSDLVNWDAQPVAIKPQMTSNSKGSWSGSTTILVTQNSTPAILFTGINPDEVQAQNLALPKNISDPFLREWFLVPDNPVMSPTPDNHINKTSFRDPTTAWILPDGQWRVLVGSKTGDVGKALMFKSRDFLSWKLTDRPLYSYQNSGMWECPDFFPVYKNGSKVGADTSTFNQIVVKHVLKVSLDDNKHDVYTLGSYDTMTDVYTPDVGFLNDSSLRYDYGKYYASKTFFDDSTNRRILTGWVNESSAPDEYQRRGWSGIHGIPRSIWLARSGNQLIQWPIAEIEGLREKAVRISNQLLEEGSRFEITGVTAAQADVSISFKIKDMTRIEYFDAAWTDPWRLCSQKGASVKGSVGPFGLLTLASKNLEEFTAVYFRVFRSTRKYVVLMCTDQRRSSRDQRTDKTTYGAFLDVNPITDGISLRTLIDHSTIESFGGEGKSVITARVYPTLATFHKAHLHVFNFGTENVEILEGDAWSMKRANIA